MKLVASLISLLTAIFTWWKRKEMVEQGRNEQILDAIKEVEARVDKADAVVVALDPARNERLRDRFDRSHGDQ